MQQFKVSENLRAISYKTPSLEEEIRHTENFFKNTFPEKKDER